MDNLYNIFYMFKFPVEFVLLSFGGLMIARSIAILLTALKICFGKGAVNK